MRLCWGCGFGLQGFETAVRQPDCLILTIRWEKAITFAQAGDPLVPFSLPAGYVKTRGQDPASSHILKTYSGLMFTVPRRDMTRNSRAHHPCKEPPCAARGSLHNRPQHGCWAPTQRASLARDVSEFQYLNNVTRCANKQHQP